MFPTRRLALASGLVTCCSKCAWMGRPAAQEGYGGCRLRTPVSSGCRNIALLFRRQVAPSPAGRGQTTRRPSCQFGWELATVAPHFCHGPPSGGQARGAPGGFGAAAAPRGYTGRAFDRIIYVPRGAALLAASRENSSTLSIDTPLKATRAWGRGSRSGPTIARAVNTSTPGYCGRLQGSPAVHGTLWFPARSFYRFATLAK